MLMCPRVSHAVVLFFNAFSSQLSSNESVSGGFGIVSGALGASPYRDSMNAHYLVTVQTQGYHSLALTFDLAISAELCCDFVYLYAGRTPSGGALVVQRFNVGSGTRRISLAEYDGSAAVSLDFNFISDGSVTFGPGGLSQVLLDNVAVTGESNTPTALPEPVMPGLLGLGVLCCAALRRRVSHGAADFRHG